MESLFLIGSRVWAHIKGRYRPAHVIKYGKRGKRKNLICIRLVNNQREIFVEPNSLTARRCRP